MWVRAILNLLLRKGSPAYKLSPGIIGNLGYGFIHDLPEQQIDGIHHFHPVAEITGQINPDAGLSRARVGRERLIFIENSPGSARRNR